MIFSWPIGNVKLQFARRLSWTSQIASPSQVKYLHSQGANLLSVDESHMTALHHASKLGSLDLTKYLIDNGNLCHMHLSF